MRVLVIGSGAREHALAARLAAEPAKPEVLCAPGNPGIARVAGVAAVSATDVDSLVKLARDRRVDLTIVGPEAPLSLGIADAFSAAALPIVGPTAAAARLESSKVFAKQFMARHGIPTARFRVCDAEADALAVLHSGEFDRVVVKADGLAAGKGVVVAADRDEAARAIRAAMRERRFGDAGRRIVLEECLSGPEVSFFVLSDGERALAIGTAQDHKRIFDDDRGPNTGGMGAFAPSPLVEPRLEARIMDTIVDPVLAGMRAEGYPFHGFLYAGLILTADGPKVIEFNVRLGDPEAQVVLPVVDEPLLPLFAEAASGRLAQPSTRFAARKYVGVVIASRGYPEAAEQGAAIHGIDAAEALDGVSVFHAGTSTRDHTIVTAGGRVLTIVGRGDDFAAAIERAYAGVARISFDGMQYRRDIGRNALGR